MDKRVKHWNKISSEYYKKYLQIKKESTEARKCIPEKIPEFIAEFCKKYRFAMDVPFVANEIKTWMQERNYKALKTLQPKRGNRSARACEIEIEGLMLIDKVKKIVRQGKTKTAAFEIIGGNGWETTKRKYYRALKKKPHVYFSKISNEYILKVGPIKVANGENPIAYGFWEIRTPIK